LVSHDSSISNTCPSASITEFIIGIGFPHYLKVGAILEKALPNYGQAKRRRGWNYPIIEIVAIVGAERRLAALPLPVWISNTV
jgi:hypothetical protein